MAILLSGQWRPNRIRNQQLNRLKRQQREIIDDQLMPGFLALRERQQATFLFQQSSLKLLFKELTEGTPDLLRQKLKGGSPDLRLLVIFIVGQRRLHLEKELIDCLIDPVPVVRDAARMILIRVARGTDFGPIPGASQRGIERSIDKWKQWLALQKSASAGTLAKAPPLEIVPLVLVGEERSAPPPEAAKLSEELVNAAEDEQRSVLARLRDAKGIDNTDALALAIPKLSGAIQREARDALTQRLTRMTAATLRDKLQDDNIEVRRAAALACGRKNAKEHIADLLQLLDDPEAVVVQSARAALTELTGEDFGPAGDADRRGRATAAAAWRKWWKERPDN